MPLSDDAFHEFEDGWGIKFTVNDRIGCRQVKTIEDDEIADKSAENLPFTYQDDIDPAEMAGIFQSQVLVTIIFPNRHFQ